MIVRNFKNIMAAFNMYKLGSNAGFGDGYLSFRSSGGATYYCDYRADALYMYGLYIALPYGFHTSGTGLTPSDYVYGLMAGSGDTPVTYNDYTITPISGLVHVSTGYSSTYDSDKKKWVFTGYHVMQNNGATSITVKEMGLFGAGLNNGSKIGCLFAREVLSSPLTVPAGGYFKLTMTFEFDVTDPTA